MNVYAQFGLEPIINAAGTSTRVGGPLMHPKAIAAMAEAAWACVPLDRLQGAASSVIAEVTGAEAGYVTAGAAAGLTLSAAACLAGLEIGIIDRLPDTSGLPNEIILSREQRNGYDHALRAAGARLIEVGMNERVAGAGVRRTETWEFEAAMSDRTVAVAYFATPDSAPPLEEVAAVCRQRGVPLIVDAAGQFRRPPICAASSLPAPTSSPSVAAKGYADHRARASSQDGAISSCQSRCSTSTSTSIGPPGILRRI
jgi:L-seryl-tRNA(Ser) seleniumtransferase